MMLLGTVKGKGKMIMTNHGNNSSYTTVTLINIVHFKNQLFGTQYKCNLRSVGTTTGRQSSTQTYACLPSTITKQQNNILELFSGHTVGIL